MTDYVSAVSIPLFLVSLFVLFATAILGAADYLTFLFALHAYKVKPESFARQLRGVCGRPVNDFLLLAWSALIVVPREGLPAAGPDLIATLRQKKRGWVAFSCFQVILSAIEQVFFFDALLLVVRGPLLKIIAAFFLMTVTLAQLAGRNGPVALVQRLLRDARNRNGFAP